MTGWGSHELQRIQDGDPQAWRRLIERAHGRLYRFLLHLTGCPEDAEDLVQEAFVRLWERRLDWRFTHLRELQAWLHRVVHHCAVDRARRLQRAAAAPGEAELHPVASPADAIAARSDEARAVWEAVQALGDIHRLPVLLHYFGGLGCAEIATVLDVPRGTVISRLHTARARLRETLSAQGVTGYELSTAGE